MAPVAPEKPDITLQLFPKESFTASQFFDSPSPGNETCPILNALSFKFSDWMLLFRIIIPAYLVTALSQFIMYLLMLIVREKETKIKETLKIAGLKDSVFW